MKKRADRVCIQFSNRDVCLTLDALRSTPLQTDGDPSGFYRTSQEEQTPNNRREARSTRPEISILPDNMTRITVRRETLAPPPALRTLHQHVQPLGFSFDGWVK